VSNFNTIQKFTKETPGKRAILPCPSARLLLGKELSPSVGQKFLILYKMYLRWSETRKALVVSKREFLRVLLIIDHKILFYY